MNGWILLSQLHHHQADGVKDQDRPQSFSIITTKARLNNGKEDSPAVHSCSAIMDSNCFPFNKAIVKPEQLVLFWRQETGTEQGPLCLGLKKNPCMSCTYGEW